MGMYPTAEDDTPGLLNDVELANYRGTPMGAQAFVRSRLSVRGTKLKNHYPLIDPDEANWQHLHYLPAYDRRIVARREDLSVEDAYIGRISEDTIPVYESGEEASADLEGGVTLGTFDSAFCDGRTWMNAKIAEARANGRYHPMQGNDGKGLTHLTATFLRNPDRAHPYSGVDGTVAPYNRLRSMTLVNIMSSNCANDSDGLFELGTEVINGVERPRRRVLSNMIVEPEQALREEIGPRRFRRVIIDTIMIHKVLADLLKDNAVNDVKGTKLENLQDRAMNSRGVSEEAREQAENFFRSSDKDPYALRIPWKAAERLIYLTKLEKHKATHKADLPRIKGGKDYAMKEFVEAFAMGMQTIKMEQKLNYRLENGQRTMGVNPIRMKMHGFGPQDFNFAQWLGWIEDGEYAEACQDIAGTYGNPKSADKRFIVGPTQGNTLWISQKSLYSNNYSQDGKLGGAAFSGKFGIPHMSPQGTYPGEIIESALMPGKRNMFPGLLGRFILATPEGTRLEGWWVDLLQAPSGGVRWVDEMKILERTDHKLPETPDFHDIFSRLPEQREIIVCRSDGEDMKPIGILEPGTQATYVRTKDGDDVRVQENIIENRLEKHKRLKKGPLKPADAEYKRKTYEVSGLPLQAGEVAVAGIANFNVPYVAESVDSEANGTHVVMPGQGRHTVQNQRKLIEAS